MLKLGFKLKKRYIALALAVLTLIWFSAQIKVTEPTPKSVDVLLIGDSITYGWNFYRQPLHEQFGEKVAIEGIGGIDTLDLGAILSSTEGYRMRLSIPWWVSTKRADIPFTDMHLALKHYKPHVVVLEIGVNNWLRTFMGQNEKQIEDYKVSRNYKDTDLQNIQKDAALGSINKRGVIQSVMQIKVLYGADTPIVLVGAFPTYHLPDPVWFNGLLKELAKSKDTPLFTNITYLDSSPIAQIAWSKEKSEYYGHSSFPAQKNAFDSIHVDWGHLNQKGYEIYAKMLECPVKIALKAKEDKSVPVFDCPPIQAVDMNTALAK